MLAARLFLPACLIIFTLGVFYSYDNSNNKDDSLKRTAGFDAGLNPIQIDLSSAEPITLSGDGAIWRMYPRASFQIVARVLHSQRYEDWQADFSPVDLALGWGVMGDPGVDRWVEVRQENRWYFYRKQANAPLSLEDIRNSSANVHIIPASEELADVIQELRPNDIVLMEGKLVDVVVDNTLGEKFHFQTSLTRSDSEDNSCEIFFVESIVTNAREAKK